MQPFPASWALHGASNKVTLRQLVHKLGVGELSSRDLVESCLEKIEDANGEGARAFRTINAQARESTDAVDASRATGRPLPVFAGIPISIKDLFDAEGESTLAGSEVLAMSAGYRVVPRQAQRYP